MSLSVRQCLPLVLLLEEEKACAVEMQMEGEIGLEKKGGVVAFVLRRHHSSFYLQSSHYNFHRGRPIPRFSSSTSQSHQVTHLQLRSEREGRSIVRDGVRDVISRAWTTVAIVVRVVDTAGERVLG